MGNRDTEVRPDTWTRSELLAERGYPEGIINGHRRPDQETVSSRPEPAGTAVAIPTDEPAESGARSCSECGGPVGPGRQTTCSPECAALARRRRDRERKRRGWAASNGDGSPGPELEAVTVTPAEIGLGAPSPPLELEAVKPAELVNVAPPLEPEAGAGGIAVSLADEFEECAGLLRRIARRLTG
jgi:hypothetical protein